MPRHQCCQDACVISEQWDISNHQSCTFETLQDLTIRCFMWYWITSNLILSNFLVHYKLSIPNFFMQRMSVSVPMHDDFIKWKHFPRYWPFVRGINRSPVNSPHKGQWRGALMFSLIWARINGWVNNGEAGDLRRHSCPLWRHCNRKWMSYTVTLLGVIYSGLRYRTYEIVYGLLWIIVFLIKITVVLKKITINFVMIP